jgi:hypothetical protein
VLRRHDAATDSVDFERLADDEPREVASLQTGLRLARAEQASLAQQIRPGRRAVLRRRLSPLRRLLARP